MENFLSVFPTAESFGTLGYWLVLLAALVESLAVIGAVFPGGILIIAGGFLAASGYLALGDLIWFTTLGAIFGDNLSYYLGTKGKRFFFMENRLLRLGYLERGEAYFKHHGRASIFLSKFVAPLRPIMPFIAGLAKVNRWFFLVLDGVGAFIWTTLFLLLGYISGSAIITIEAWSTRIGFLLVLLIIVLMLFWLVLKRSLSLLTLFKSIFSSVIEAILANSDVRNIINNHPLFFKFLKQRLSPKRFSGLPLTLLIIAFIYVLNLFWGTIQSVITSNQVIASDVRTANLLHIFRDSRLIKFFLWITLLGKTPIVLGLTSLASLIFWAKRKPEYFVSLWLTVLGSGFFVYLAKLLVHRTRPALSIYTESSFSFPSGHATLAVALYGFLAYTIWRSRNRWKYKINLLFLCLAVITSVGFSRLYLQVHFFSDVWGGYLLGSLWVIIGISISEWLKIKKNRYIEKLPSIQPNKIKIIIAGLILANIVLYLAYAWRYSPAINSADLKVEEITITDVSNIFQDYKLSPYTETLSGAKQEPINLILAVESDEQLIMNMWEVGWYLADLPNPRSMALLAKSAILDENYPAAPMTPSFWNAEAHAFGFEKPTEAKSVRERHHVRFWRTQFRTPYGKIVYVATSSLDIGIKWLFTHRIDPAIDTEREYLFNDLMSAGLVSTLEKIQLVEPTLGSNFSGDQFFTDGKADIIFLK